MEDYKQKYEEALENIKAIKAANKDNKGLVDFIEFKYPKLKKNKDERIRENLIKFFRDLDALEYKEEDVIAWLEKQGEKPAWSEEDERNLEGIINEIEANKNNAPDYDLATYDRFLSWLKSLKDRIQPQPKQEWCEEDEKLINEVADSLRKYSNYVQGGNSKVYILSLADSIESLQPRYAWLPSDKQMQELYNLVCDCRPADTQLLLDIYNGLKSLKEINKV